MDGTTTQKKNRDMAPIGPTETIRHLLQLNQTEFALALGFSAGAYSDMQRAGRVTKTTALAAEALMRRQAPDNSDRILLITITKGAPLTTDITHEVKELTFDGVTYYMVPKGR